MKALYTAATGMAAPATKNREHFQQIDERFNGWIQKVS